VYEKVFYLEISKLIRTFANINMKNKIYFTRRGKLKSGLELNLLNKTVGSNEIEVILNMVDEYEKDNVDTIEKLKRDKKVELNKINGALRQTINAHGDITKILIGSASKRIYGSLLTSEKPKQTLLEKILTWIK
jgi:hypothetical protein